MQIILIIIGIIIAIAVIGMIIDFIKEHPVGVVFLILVIFTAFVAWPVAVGLTLVWIIVMLASKAGGKSNTRKLLRYLEKNCQMMGCLDGVDLSTVAPAFVGKKYENSTYEGIVRNYINSIENQFITQDKEYHWLTNALVYLEDNQIADVYELEKLSSDALRYSHLTPNGKLICDAMKALCATRIVNGQHKYSQIKLEAEGVRTEMNLPPSAPVADFYLWAFKAEDVTKRLTGSAPMGNMDSEEISMDDLGINV